MGSYIVPGVPFDIAPMGESDQYSGARVARMILISVGLGGIGTAGDPMPPTALYNSISGLDDLTEPSPFWYIDPGAMNAALNNMDPQGPNFVLYTEASPANAHDQLHSTLQDYQVAAAVLVHGGAHWICVTGYTYNTPADFNGFYFNDPAYGSMANAWLATADWDTEDIAVTGGARWLGQIIEVGDPRPIKQHAVAAPRPIVRPGDSIIPPADAVKLAIEGVQRQCPELPHLRQAIKEGRPGQPRLVTRLDREGDYFYLVPLESEVRDRQHALAVIKLDARLGDVLSAMATDSPRELWPIRTEDVREIVAAHPIPVREPLDTVTGRLLDTITWPRWSIGGTGGLPQVATQTQGHNLRGAIAGALASYASPREYITLRPYEIEVGPILTWGPCGSISSFYPYYVVRTPWRNLYVSAQSGIIRTSFELCPWMPLGA